MQKIIEGFIVKETPYQESSKIIQLLTKEYGIIGVIAKGAKNVKSPLRAVSTRLTYGLFNLYFKEDKLSTLISVDLIEDLSNIKTDLTLINKPNYKTRRK